VAIAEAGKSIRPARSTWRSPADRGDAGAGIVVLAGIADLRYARSGNTSKPPAGRSRSIAAGFGSRKVAAFLVLESAARAQRRGARIYADLVGSGLSCDATHLTNRTRGTGASDEGRAYGGRAAAC